MTTFGVPGTNVIFAGDTETPAGTLATWTLICEVKPLIPVADKETVAELPASRGRLVGLTAKLKSGGGGGGG
ncbi:MAG: hypothetical protein WAN60_11465 [Candidatus Sulfotelmatobacter sp.]